MRLILYTLNPPDRGSAYYNYIILDKNRHRLVANSSINLLGEGVIECDLNSAYTVPVSVLDKYEILSEFNISFRDLNNGNLKNEIAKLFPEEFI